MSYYNELVTVYAVRATYLGVIANDDDVLLRDLIRSVCADMERSARRYFAPRIETRYYDAQRDVHSARLWLDDDLLAVTTLLNGDGTSITSNQYVTNPRHTTPTYALQLKSNANLAWTWTTTPEDAIALTGVWGYHTDYANAWMLIDTLGAAITTTTATTATLVTADSVRAGDILRIGTEYLYAGAVSGTALSSLARGANGSTAATHAQGDAIYVWTQTTNLVQLAKECTAARYRLRENPLAESFTLLDGTAISTPKDVGAYITKRLSMMGYLSLV